MLVPYLFGYNMGISSLELLKISKSVMNNSFTRRGFPFQSNSNNLEPSNFLGLF